MKRKSLPLFGLALLLSLIFIQSCAPKPEEAILKRYFGAVKMNDRTTMGSIAMEPIHFDLVSWEIIGVSEEKVEPAPLFELNARELGLKKQVEDSVVVTIEAKEDLDDAVFELENARTRTARKAAQDKVDELQARYEGIRDRHNKLQADYSEAKNAAAREEAIVKFSLRAGEIPNIRDLTGDIHTKEAEIKVVAREGTKKYRCYLRKYNLKDEALNLTRRGGWIIVRFEPLD